MKYKVTATIIVEADDKEEAEIVMIEQMFQSSDMNNVYDMFEIVTEKIKPDICTEQ